MPPSSRQATSNEDFEEEIGRIQSDTDNFNHRGGFNFGNTSNTFQTQSEVTEHNRVAARALMNMASQIDPSIASQHNYNFTGSQHSLMPFQPGWANDLLTTRGNMPPPLLNPSAFVNPGWSGHSTDSGFGHGLQGNPKRSIGPVRTNSQSSTHTREDHRFRPYAESDKPSSVAGSLTSAGEKNRNWLNMKFTEESGYEHTPIDFEIHSTRLAEWKDIHERIKTITAKSRNKLLKEYPEYANSEIVQPPEWSWVEMRFQAPTGGGGFERPFGRIQPESTDEMKELFRKCELLQFGAPRSITRRTTTSARGTGRGGRGGGRGGSGRGRGNATTTTTPTTTRTTSGEGRAAGGRGSRTEAGAARGSTASASTSRPTTTFDFNSLSISSAADPASNEAWAAKVPISRRTTVESVAPTPRVSDVYVPDDNPTAIIPFEEQDD
ncbi:uncharacterized protein L201_002277 [Kwoniella dendrophila CBS 6074]|uniref:Uncharacterized protein n=1 Tax=Kwoniella dendrophila CBS 6074 TaxID=1295534 RepID=A0AAX4JSD8_9TREE